MWEDIANIFLKTRLIYEEIELIYEKQGEYMRTHG